MNYTIHKLNSQNHSHIIGRQDSVTGDKVNENDKVVFCSVCKSVFLIESWEYMDRKHCNQTQTLDFVPSPIPVLVAKKKLRGKNSDDKLIVEFSNKELEGAAYTLPSFISSSIIGVIANSNNSFIWSILSFLTCVILSVGIFKSMKKDKVRRFLKLDKKTIRIFETGIELQNERFYKYDEIEKIEYIREDYSRSFFHRKKRHLLIHLKDGGIIKQEVASKSHLSTEPLFYGLRSVAKFVEVHFYTKDEKELKLVKSIERNYTGSIFIGQNYPQIESID